MRKLLGQLWNDDCGALLAIEFLFDATILVIGTVVGLSALANAINVKLTELGNAILALNLSYTVSGTSGCNASTAGTAVIDIFTPLVCPTAVAPIPSVINCPPCT